MNPDRLNSNQASLDWRQRLQESIAENPYAKYAEAPPPKNVLHILHAEPDQADPEG
jgi:hypothetical protein